MRYDAPDWDKAVAALRDADEVAIACHVNPDGDALGSLFAASLGLRKLGKTTYPSWGTAGAVVPPAYTFMPGSETLVQPDQMPETATFLALDCGAGDRLGDLEPLVRSAPASINVDHHPGNDDFATFNVVVEGASSTAELMGRMLLDVGASFDSDIATCLYVGLVTDTGRFQYASTTPETLRLAADLLEFGVDAPRVAQEVFESSPFGYLKLVGRVLDRAVLLEDEGFVYSWVLEADLVETGVSVDETEKLIDAVRSTRAADVAALFKQIPDGTFRASLRSKGATSVGAIARSLGGGGHDLAAGFTTDAVESAVETIRAALSD